MCRFLLIGKAKMLKRCSVSCGCRFCSYHLYLACNDLFLIHRAAVELQTQALPRAVGSKDFQFQHSTLVAYSTCQGKFPGLPIRNTKLDLPGIAWICLLVGIALFRRRKVPQRLSGKGSGAHKSCFLEKMMLICWAAVIRISRDNDL